MIRRILLGVGLLAGVFWLVSTFAFSYPSKTQSVDRVTNSFRPFFTNQGVHQAQTDIGVVDGFATQFQTQAVPALAAQLKTTPTALVQNLSTNFPAVGAGIGQLPQSLPYFDNLVAGLAAHQQDFHQADAIPTKNLPTTTVHWLFVVLGLIAIGLAGAGLAWATWSKRSLAGLGVLGVLVIVASLVLSVPQKTQGTDNLQNFFRPVFTTQGAAQARSYLNTVKAMDTQLTAQALPALAAQLHVTPAALNASLGQQFPAVAAGLTQLPAILGRFDALVSAIERNVADFQRADHIPTKGTPTTLVQAQLVMPGLALMLVGLVTLALALAARPRPTTLVHRSASTG